ncbi:fimbrial protein [Pseudomonas sp. RtIB026]|uniref:fimbrial protein n=1 Tax=Pseudomonas sp. RtIB026 TaxID=2749999 RepID=UPI001941F149|nr:fimbrial protein [Pseudomonas sp. RtIB026]
MHEVIGKSVMLQGSCLKCSALWFKLVILGMLGIGSPVAFAQNPGANCQLQASTTPVSMPASITIPRDAANGTVLTSWVTSAQKNNYYQCSVTAANGVQPSTGMAFQPLSLTKAGLNVPGPNGASYTVWNTNVPGIGLAVGVRVHANGCGWQPWADLGTPSGFLGSPWRGSACNASNPPITNGAQVQMALVKTGSIATGTVTGGVLLEGTSITAMSLNGTYAIATSGRQSFSLSSTIINVASCRTPDVTVDLGSHKQSRFTGVGSTSPAVSFSVNVNNCPAGLNSIQYQFNPVTSLVGGSNGVLGLSGGSTAKGIGVQLKDRNGTALKYNTQYTLSNYNGATGGSYTIPLTAAYYQTSSTVTAGSANAVLTFTMTYQ